MIYYNEYNDCHWMIFKNGGGGGYSRPIYHGCKRIFKVVAVYKCVLYKSRIVCVCVLNREEI